MLLVLLVMVNNVALCVLHSRNNELEIELRQLKIKMNHYDTDAPPEVTP